MNVSWVLGDDVSINSSEELEFIKSVGPTWGSWKTWKSALTDNVICVEPSTISDLVNKGFHKNCNFYVPEGISVSVTEGRINRFGGTFPFEMERREEVVSMFLTGSTSDVVLLYGVTLDSTRSDHYKGLVSHLLKTMPAQWVFVDIPYKLDPDVSSIESVSVDSLKNIVKWFKSES